MEHKTFPTIRSLALQAKERFRGFGENDSEILVTHLDDREQSLKALRAFMKPETAAIALLDNSAEGLLHKTLQWLGAHMIYQSERMTFHSLDHCIETLPGTLSSQLHIARHYRGFEEHCQILKSDIAINLTTIRNIFNLESGFQLDLSKEKLSKPVWHVDDIGDGGMPSPQFVRFVRVPHADGTYIALREKSRNVFATGNSNRSYDVRNYAMGGGHGLYVIKGSTIHSPPVPSDGKYRTVYTITPHYISPSRNYRMT